MKQYIKIGMSVALASLLSISVSGCSDSGSDGTPASAATDITVERGKVYEANVKDSSTPAQVATQKVGQNVYTFSSAPTYPVIVNGGWIDVNADGKMDSGDIKLDIEMRSYGTTVTPITTVIATFPTALDRDTALQSLADNLNENGVGSDTQVTVADLLKVPSAAPRDVMVVSNATFKDMKENNTLRPDLYNVMSQFSSIYGSLANSATAADIEKAVMDSLLSQNLVGNVTAQDILDFNQKLLDLGTPPVVTPPTTGGDTTLNLSGYSSIIIYKNIAQTTADILLGAYSNNSGFKFENKSASCEDFGFTNPTVTNAGGISIKNYFQTSPTVRSCSETDYSGAAVGGGSANIVAYYGGTN